MGRHVAIRPKWDIRTTLSRRQGQLLPRGNPAAQNFSARACVRVCSRVSLSNSAPPLRLPHHVTVAAGAARHQGHSASITAPTRSPSSSTSQVPSPFRRVPRRFLIVSSSLPPLVPRARGCRFGGRYQSHSHPLRRLDPPVPRARGSRSEDSGLLFWRSFRGLSSAVLATVLRTFLESCGDSSTTFPKIVPHMVGYGGLTGGSSAGRWWRRWRSPCTGTRGRSGGLGRGRTRPGPSHRHTSSRSAFASAARGAPLAARR